MSEPENVFLLRRKHWQYDDSSYYAYGAVTMKAFRRRESAERELWELEQAGDGHFYEMNPFWAFDVGFAGATSMSEDDLLERVTLEELPVPPVTNDDFRATRFAWGTWWNGLDPEQKRRMRQHLENFRQFEIVEVPLSSLNVEE